MGDFTIGCKFIAEKSVDCGRGSLACLLASCVPGSRRIAPWRRPSLREYPEGSRRSLRSSPAVQIKLEREKTHSASHTVDWVPDSGSDDGKRETVDWVPDSGSDDGKRETDASASGHHSD